MKFAKLLRTPFFTEHLQELLLRFSRESRIKTGVTVSNKYQVQLKIRHTGKVGPGTRDFPLGALYLGPGTRDPWVKLGTRDLEPSTWSSSPGTRYLWPYIWDPIQRANTWEQSKKTHFVYQSTVFCIALILIYSLEFNSQFLIIAKWFQINTCWLFQFWITWCWKFN